MDARLSAFLQENQKAYEEISDRIWDYAETRYKEAKSAALQSSFLEEQGFAVEREIGGIATAFKAVYGSGYPVIGYLGEYDALPGLSQEADCPSYTPKEKGAPGHGCGHNLLGTACMEAAVAVKKYMEENALPGTIIYFGCPAEESGAAKAFMVREGCFQGVDYALSWHPGTKSNLFNRSLANVRMILNFHGKSAHAAANPESGRSALDACELTNIGVQYLREHVPSECRMHSAYLNCGGDAPNVIPAEASLLYALRAPHSAQVKDLIERVSDIGRGAALMTGSKVDIKVVSAYAEILPVKAMDDLMVACMEEVLPLDYTEEELAYAAAFAKANGLKEDAPVIDTSLTFGASGSLGSTDVGNVSWVCPTGCVCVTTMANGTAGHSWSLTAQGKSPIAKKGMHKAAAVLAEAALRLLIDEKLRETVTEDYRKIRAAAEYANLLPEDVMPGDF